MSTTTPMDLAVLSGLRAALRGGGVSGLVDRLAGAGVTPGIWQAALGDLTANHLLDDQDIARLSATGLGADDMECRVLLAGASRLTARSMAIVRETAPERVEALLTAMLSTPSERVILLALEGAALSDWWTEASWARVLAEGAPRVRERALLHLPRSFHTVRRAYPPKRAL